MTTDPVIVEMGERGKNQIRKLRQGRGRIRTDIDSVLDGLRERGEVTQDAQVVIVVIKQRVEERDDCWWR